VLLIGTSRYTDDELHDLPTVANNLEGLGRALVELGVEPGQIRTLPEPQDARDISRAVRETSDAANDVLFVYYSGHGILDERQRLYLSVTRSSPEDVPETSFAFERVRSLVQRSRAQCRVVVLDCCYSGRALELSTALEN
jgi:uncharacterized caspase-like protein